MHNLSNKWAFITGAGSGIGYETCLAFAQEGCNIIASDISQENINKVAVEVLNLGVQVREHLLDVSDEAAVKALADRIIQEQGCPDVVINNAGIALVGDVEDHTKEMWQKTFDINVMGVVFGTQAFLGAMKQKQSPSFIVNISSQASRTPYVYMSAYAASKYAVEGFTDSLRTELAVNGSHVRTISIHPGIINTPIVPTSALSVSPKAMENIHNKYNKQGSHPSVVAKDIVKAVVKDKAAVMTGTMSTTGFWMNKLLPKKWLAKLIAADAVKTGFTTEVS